MSVRVEREEYYKPSGSAYTGKEIFKEPLDCESPCHRVPGDFIQ